MSYQLGSADSDGRAELLSPKRGTRGPGRDIAALVASLAALACDRRCSPGGCGSPTSRACGMAASSAALVMFR